MKKYQAMAPLLLAMLIAIVTLFPCLGTITGLHGDEAWVGLRAHEIVEGSRPMLGMNAYTGPVHQYLVAALFDIFGYGVGVLRLFTAVAALTNVVLYHRLIKLLFDGSIADLAVLLLVSMPFFTIYGRLAYEVFALNPLLALGAIFLLLESNKHSFPSIYHLIGGICLGLGTWNHIIFIAVPFALLIAVVFQQGLGLLRRPALYLVLYGFFLGLCPRIIIQLSSGRPIEFHGSLQVPVLERMKEWPALLLEIAHGDILYKRCAGQLMQKSPNLILLILVIAVTLRWGVRLRMQRESKGYGFSVIIFGIALFVGTLFLCPSNSDRYFLLILYLIPLACAWAFHEISQISALKGFFPLIIILFVLLQLSRTGLNYFYSQIETGGRSSAFLMGSQVETSNHFMRSDLLYRDLVSRGAKVIYTESLLAWPLQFYDLKNQEFTLVSAEDLVHTSLSERVHSPDAFAVFYADGVRQIQPDQYPNFKITSQDLQFIVMESASPLWPPK